MRALSEKIKQLEESTELGFNAAVEEINRIELQLEESFTAFMERSKEQTDRLADMQKAIDKMSDDIDEIETFDRDDGAIKYQDTQIKNLFIEVKSLREELSRLKKSNTKVIVINN